MILKNQNKIIFFLLFYYFILIESQSINNTSSSLSLQCRGDLIYRDVTNRIEDEKNGFNFVEYNETYQSCVIPCPSPFFTIEKWNEFLNMSLVMGTISFFCGLFLLVTYSPIVNKTHNRHTIGVMCMSFGVCLAMCSDMWNFGSNFNDKSICPSPGQYLTTSNARCLSSGIFLQFGGVFGFLNWTLLSFDLYMNIKGIITKNYDKYYVAATLVIAIIFTFVPIVNDQYSMSYIGLGCWLGSAMYQLIFFWILLSICLIVSSVFIILILKEVYTIIKLSKQKTSLNGNIRPLLCISITGFAFFYMFFYYISIVIQGDYYETILKEYTDCLMDPTKDISECKSPRMSVASEFVFLLCLRLLGIGAFIFYGINNKVKKIWLNSYWFNNSFVDKFITRKSFDNDISNSNGSKVIYRNNNNNNKNYNNNNNSSFNTGLESSIIEMSTNSNKEESSLNSILKQIQSQSTLHPTLNHSLSSSSLSLSQCRGDLIYRDVTNRIEDEKNGFNFVEYNGTYVPCVIPCPSPFFTLEEWNKLLYMSLVMGTISFLCGLFLLVTYSPIVNKTHNRHTVGVMCMSFGVCIAMSSDMWNYGYNFTDVKSICPSPGQYLTTSNARCLSSGVVLQFGGVFGFLNWTLLSFDLYMNIKGIITKNYDKYYVVATLVIAIIFTFVPIVNDQYSMSYINLGCWLGSAMYQLIFFWILLSICLIVSSVFIILILKEIYSIIKLSKQKTSLKGNIRPLLCITITSFAFFYMFFYYISIVIQGDYYETILKEYTNCLMDPTKDVSQCKSPRMSVANEFVFLLCLRLLGIGAFIFYVKKIWLNSFWFNNCFVNRLGTDINRSSFGSKVYNKNYNNNSSYNSGLELSIIDMSYSNKDDNFKPIIIK
ncbi:hypothetical protein ACTFIU_006045 [Dictyostelium citrinum]